MRDSALLDSIRGQEMLAFKADLEALGEVAKPKPESVFLATARNTSAGDQIGHAASASQPCATQHQPDQ